MEQPTIKRFKPKEPLFSGFLCNPLTVQIPYFNFNGINFWYYVRQNDGWYSYDSDYTEIENRRARDLMYADEITEE